MRITIIVVGLTAEFETARDADITSPHGKEVRFRHFEVDKRQRRLVLAHLRDHEAVNCIL